MVAFADSGPPITTLQKLLHLLGFQKARQFRQTPSRYPRHCSRQICGNSALLQKETKEVAQHGRLLDTRYIDLDGEPEEPETIVTGSELLPILQEA